MNLNKYYGLILGLAAIGLLLSGYLSYWNLFGPGCHEGPLSWLVSCGGPQKVLIFGLPTCVYGFAMYLTVATLAVIGMMRQRSDVLNGIRLLGVVGTLFAAGLTIYELWILKIQFSGLPACVYGLVLYAGILVTSHVAHRQLRRAAA